MGAVEFAEICHLQALEASASATARNRAVTAVVAVILQREEAVLICIFEAF